jgi:hypothetical protein
MAFPTNNYDPRLIVVDEANGSTLTRATIRAFTKQDFEDQAYKEVQMDRIIAQTKEARMAGVKERTLMDLLLSRHVALPQKRGGGSASIIAPFELVPRENIWNANYFQVEAGTAHPGAGVGSIPASAWQITVNVGSSPWVSSPSASLKSLEKFFLPGGQLMVEYVNTTTNVARTVQFKIIAAENANSGSTEKALVSLEPNKSAAGWAALSSDDKAVYQPTYGTVSLLANSVSDYESYGHQFPGVNNMSLIEYWQQTIRKAWSVNEEYIKALESPLTSEFFKKFRSLPIAKQRKQQENMHELELFNTFFYGEEISEKQTVEGYTQLELVKDPADSNYPIEYKSNTLGIRSQLSRGARVLDKQGAALDLDSIMEQCYNLKRNRENGGGSVTVVDFMTDRFTASRVRDIMIKYYKAKFSSDLTMYYQAGQKIKFNDAVALEYNLYDLPDQGMQMAVFTDEYFNDRLSAFATNQKSRARAFWGVDWSDVAINVIKTNSANRTTNVADELYRYVITPNVKKTILESKTIQVRVGDGNRHSLTENFSDDSPVLTVPGVDIG